jgi:hypothetical protein
MRTGTKKLARMNGFTLDVFVMVMANSAENRPKARAVIEYVINIRK